MRIGPILVILCLMPALAAETYEERLEATDLRDPNALYELAMWCGGNNLERSKLKHLREAMRLDPEHAPSREALGYVYYKGRWTHVSRLPGDATGGGDTGGAGTGGPAGLPTGPAGAGPSAEQIEWTLSPWHHPDEDAAVGQHVRSWIEKVQSTGNMTNTMESGWRTLMMDEHFPIAVALLSQGMADGRYKDCFAPAMIMDEMRRTRDERLPQAEKLLPFIIAAASKGGASAEDQQVAAMVAANSGEKKAVPWLISLLGSGDEFTASSARMAISAITFLPEQELTREKAQDWWNRYHNQPDSAIYGQLLQSDDPMTRLGACRRLYREQDRRILPVLTWLLRCGNRTAYMGSVDLIKRISGNDWGLFEAEGELQETLIKQWESWVQNESAGFTWVEFRNPDLGSGGGATTAVSSGADLIGKLGSADATESAGAETQLRQRGDEAVGELIHGLAHNSPIVMNKCRSLLREITGQNFGFDPLATAEQRGAAIALWKEWAAKELGLEAPAEEDGIIEEGDTASPPRQRMDLP